MSKITLKKREPNLFLEQFTLEKKYLLRFDKEKGVAALRGGIDEKGVPVLIKIWPKTLGIDDSDVREIWKNEIRQLHRLGGFPGAKDYIADLRTTHQDNSGYYLVLNPGQRRPLQRLIDDNSDGAKQNLPREFQDRILLWKNLRRIAHGLEILHSQGLLHRNLTSWSILTACSDYPDFQLTGFEWSMRITGGDTSPKGKRHPRPDLGQSFVRDWQQFGLIAATLLAVSNQRLANQSLANHEVTETKTVDEIKILRELLQIIPTERIDGHYVIERIDTILMNLTITAQTKEPQFVLITAFGENSSIASAIREASNYEIEIDDEAEQRRFVKNDLSKPDLISLAVRNQPNQFKLVLRGVRLTYVLEDFRGQDRKPSNWEFAYCSFAEMGVGFSNNIIEQIRLSGDAILLMTIGEFRRNQRIRGRYATWESLRDRLSPPADATSREQQVRKALTLTQILEYLFAASEIFPVEVVPNDGKRQQTSGDRQCLYVRPRADDEKEALSAALKLRESPAKRLADALLSDNADDDIVEGGKSGSWRLTDSPVLGGRAESSAEWQFESEFVNETGETIYMFTGEQAPQHLPNAYLISEGAVGRDSQLQRRIKSFKTLAEHSELSAMLVDPRGRVLRNEEGISNESGFKELDESKQKAFKEAIETLPLFLVQGPPGVGKTRLVRELVKHAFSEDDSARILLSAQSNYAVDHLLHEVEKIFASDELLKPLIVRCKAREKREEANPFEIGQQSKTLLSSLRDSTLVSQASNGLRERIELLAQAYGLPASPTIPTVQTTPPKSERIALEGLVLRAANIVFATTNSADLERLIDERAQFDWAMIEEAGKATGGELVSPMLLSHRRLMIGDHKQLPPFGSERVQSLLSDATQTRKALSCGDAMIGRLFRDSTVDEIFFDADEADESDNSTIASLCPEAIRNFFLFETLIEDEFERQHRKKTGRPIAAPLFNQHRMHPAIAQIVSDAFYSGDLKTDSECQKYFANSTSPVNSSDTVRLPDAPVVWIDMPWIQNTVYKKFGEIPPRHTNLDEVSAVKEVVSLLSSSDQKASLAILSPYSRQVSKLTAAIDTAGANSTYASSKFSPASKQKRFCNTVDSFQGSEADCVIVSLVRNNQFGTIRKGLGFLADPRRMNVLMSRARWRLIIVGSLDFLDWINAAPMAAEDRYQIKFLDNILNAIRSPSEKGSVEIVSYARLLGRTE